MVTIPLYWVGAALVTMAVIGVMSIVISVGLARSNAEKQLARYEADKVATARANQGLYCTLFGSQMDAFAEATTPTGKASYEAWLAVYKLAQCQPLRK